MKEDTLYKYLDIILLESDISEPNSSMNILYEKYLNPVTDEERDEYFRITENVVSLGIKLGYFEYISKEKTWFSLSEKGILAKEKGGHFKYVEFKKNKESESKEKSITYNINESVIGQLNQDSNFSASPISIKTNAIPSKNPETKSRLKKLLSNPWVVGISLTLLTAILNGKRVMEYINSIIDRF